MCNFYFQASYFLDFFAPYLTFKWKWVDFLESCEIGRDPCTWSRHLIHHPKALNDDEFFNNFSIINVLSRNTTNRQGMKTLFIEGKSFLIRSEKSTWLKRILPMKEKVPKTKERGSILHELQREFRSTLCRMQSNFKLMIAILNISGFEAILFLF